MPEQRMTSERLMVKECLESNGEFATKIGELLPAVHKNPVPEAVLGAYRPRDRRKAITADVDMLNEYKQKKGEIPGFLEAGPREKLAFREPAGIDEPLRVGVITTGGLAPGLNSVIHSIVERHVKTYGQLLGGGGEVWGFMDSFKGLERNTPNYMPLRPDLTESWLHKGGSELGAIRFKKHSLDKLASKIANNLDRWGIKILYVIGGDGSLKTAHRIASHAVHTVVAGIPKTMDNDVLWVRQSFGFNTAVDRAAAFITTMHAEAESTRRVVVLEFFGARSGFVAANATLASGHVDLVMIPEVFESLDKVEAERILRVYGDYMVSTIRRKPGKPHAVIVIAEGVGKVLADLGAVVGGEKVSAKDFPNQFRESLELKDIAGDKVGSFMIRPRHYIRAVPANSHDEIYCKRLGALAVDNALAGFTDFMISQWLTEFVLVPLELVAGGRKRVPTGGIFWKQVVASTGQPIVASAI